MSYVHLAVPTAQPLKPSYNLQLLRFCKNFPLFSQELRDENDELRLQCEALTQQVNTSVKRRHSHRKRQDSQKVSRHGSVLSDYTKPVVIKRNKEGTASSDESDTADQLDGRRVPSVRVSGDGGSNEDAGKLQMFAACASICEDLAFLHRGFVNYSFFINCVNSKMLQHDWLLTAFSYG